MIKPNDISNFDINASVGKEKPKYSWDYDHELDSWSTVDKIEIKKPFS